MRYPDGYKEDMRQRLLALAGAKAKTDGFSATGVDSLASAAGVTSGAVYSHFGSKGNLFAELVKSELARSQAYFSDKSPEGVLQGLKRYLNLDHVRTPDTGCVMPALSVEVARAAPQVRKAYEQSILQMQQACRESVGGDQQAWTLIALAVGAVVVSRAMAKDATRQRLLDAVLASCEEILDASAPGQ